jgi:carbon-monoxide dehydrogenase medium subunit
MIPSPFEYVVAGSVDEVIGLLTEHGDDAKLLAGGHSLLPMMKVHLAAPALLIDVARVPDLTYIREVGADLEIGATTTHAAVAGSTLVQSLTPLLARSAGLVGDPQVRHRGTIAGSLAHADPAADLPMALVALGGRVVVAGPDGTREIGADDFFVGYFETSLRPDEMIVSVRIPQCPGVAWGYEKFTRRANDWAIVGVAAVGGRVALANMGATPVRALATEQALTAGASAADAAQSAAEGTEPSSDMHANSEFRSHLARVLTRRALLATAG